MDHHAHKVLYSLWANILYSIIMWLIVSSLSPHNRHLLLSCVFSVLILTEFIIIIIIIILASFYPKRYLVALHCSDSKTTRFSRTLLSILAVRNNTVIWVSLILPLISNCSNLLFQAFWDRSKCTNYNWYHRHPHTPQLFSSKFQVFASLFAFFYFHSLVCWNDKIY